MRKYLLGIVLNVVIIGIGVLLSTSTEKVDPYMIEQNVLIPYLDNLHYGGENDFDTSYVKDFERVDTELKTINVMSTDTITLESNDRFISVKTILHYPDQDVEIISYKYNNHHIPYDTISILILVFLNTFLYLFGKDKQRKYHFHTLFTEAGSGLVIFAIILNNVITKVPIFYYLSGVYILALIVHYYILKTTNHAAYKLSIEESELHSLEDELARLKIKLRVYHRVSFSGMYYMVSVDLDQTSGLEKLLDENIPRMHLRYYVINLILIGSINIGALIYLINYFI